jgi:hypothetical protein
MFIFTNANVFVSAYIWFQNAFLLNKTIRHAYKCILLLNMALSLLVPVPECAAKELEAASLYPWWFVSKKKSSVLL